MQTNKMKNNLLLGGLFLILALFILKSEALYATETAPETLGESSLVTNLNPLEQESFFKAEEDINDIWPGQTMMEDEFNLTEKGWKPISLSHSANSLTTFPIEVEGYEAGTLVGHIRFGGVNSETGIFLTDTAKQLRNLVFIVENTKQFKDKEKKNTVKYTYNYYQGTNTTYTMVPITDMKSPGTIHQISLDPGYAFELPQGGQQPTYRTVKELYIQEIGSTGTFAIQARTGKDQGIGNLDFYFQQLKTLIPTADGGIRIVNEVKNTGWRTGTENKFPRKTFGAMIGEDTMLNTIDHVPIFSLGTNKGVYIANKLDLFRVAFPRLQKSQGAASNYEGQYFNSVLGTSNAAFQQMPDGYGNESQTLPLDARVWPASGIQPPLSGNSSTPIDERGYDTQYAQKWNPRQPPEVGQKAIMSYDVNVLPIYKPEIKLTEDSLNQSAHKDDTLTFKGAWRDYDSLNVTLYYKIASQEKAGWVEFKQDSREDKDELKDQWFDFSLELPANKFKLNGDSISFKAVDTTRVDSDIVTTNVTTFETVTIKTEHYGPTGIKLGETAVQGTPGQFYTTKPNDYTEQGLTLDESKTEGIVSGEIPQSNVLVKYHYKEGRVIVITHYLKEDLSPLFPAKEQKYRYNETYVTDPQEDAAQAENYYLTESSGEASGPTGKVDKTIEVTYYYRIGVLGIVEATGNLDFGANQLITFGSKDIFPTTDTSVKIIDELQGDWQLELRISEEFKAGNKLLAGEMYFQTKDLGLIRLNQMGQAIHSRENVTAGEIDLSWSKDQKEGLFFRQASGNQKGAYEGVLEWNIVSGL